MTVRRLQLRCSAVIADNHVYRAAMELGLLTQDMDPASIEVKRRVVARPGRKTPMCMVTSAHDGFGCTELEFVQLRSGRRQADTIAEMSALVVARAKRNGQLVRTIGFGPSRS